MTKQDWIEILSSTSQRDWADWVVIVIAIVSPLITLLAVIFTAKSAAAARSAANTSLKMYEEQEKYMIDSVKPLFEIMNDIVNSDSIIFQLKNIKRAPISVTNVAANFPLEDFTHNKIDEYLNYFKVLKEIKEGSGFTFWIYYITEDERKYVTEIIFRNINMQVVIQEQKTKRI